MTPAGTPGKDPENRYARVVRDAGISARQHWRLLLGAGGALLLVLYGYEFVAGEEGMLRTRNLRQDATRLKQRNEELKREKATLAVQDENLKLKNVESNPFLLEKLVRENRLLVRPGEILYTFDENGDDKTPEGLPEVTIAPRPPKKEKEKKPD